MKLDPARGASTLALLLLVASAAGAQSLTTTFAGGNGHNGNMFDIVAKTDVVIQGFDCNLPSGTHQLRFYRVTGGGSYQGLETSPGSWTTIGTATVVSGGMGVPTPVPIAVNTTIANGATQGFYVSIITVNTNMPYTAGTLEGSVFVEDAAIQVLEGAGLGWPFGSPTHGGSTGVFSPRVWNGVVHYTLPSGLTYVPDASPSTGTCNFIPFGGTSTWSTGTTYVARIPASSLDPSRPVIEDVAFMPCGSGQWTANAVRIAMGHLPNPLPVPFNFPVFGGNGDFLDLTVIHDSAVHGPFSWQANADQFSSLQFATRGGTGFVWNGVDDVGFFITYSGSTITSAVGSWNGTVHRTSTEPFRVYDANYNAIQSTGSGNAGAKMCLQTRPAVCVPDPDATSGTCNVIPFGQSATFSSGTTYVARLPASSFSVEYPFVHDVSFAPCGDGTWSSASVRVGFGHVPNPLPAPFNFPVGAGMGSFLDFTEVHNGPLSWDAVADTWSPLGLCGTSFQWNGVDDVGFFITFSNSNVTWNGACHRTGTEPFRVYDLNPNAAASTASGASGLKTCLDMSATPGSSFTIQVTNNGLGGSTLSLSGIPPGTTEGWTLISSSPQGFKGEGPLLGIWPDTITIATLVSFPVPSPGNPLHWTWPVPAPLFPAGVLTVPNGTMTPFAGQTWDFVAVALGPFQSFAGATCVERVVW